MSGSSRKPSLGLVALICAFLFLLTACGGSSAKFCEVAQGSSEPRNQEQINEFYAQLEAVAPSEIKDDVSILRNGWTSVTFPLGGGKLSRPEEVSQAAKNIVDFVAEECGTDEGSGVYLVNPEIGF